MKCRINIHYKHSKKGFAALFLLIFICACSHSGVNMTRSGETIQVIEGNRDMLPKRPTEFRVGPGDVFRLDASFKNLSNKPFLIEREDVIQINFYYDKGVYRIMPGDGLKVSFIADSGLDFEAMVRLDGRLTLPKIGDVDAAGKTPEELSQDIKKRYKGKINNPRATVSVLNTNLEPVTTISGEYTILPDGNISVPILGVFNAAGLSLNELAESLSSTARDYFQNNFKASVIRQNNNTAILSRYDRVVTLTPAGELILPGVGNLYIRGMSFSEVKQKLQDSLTQVYSNPVDISLTLISAASRSVYVSGQVRIPGVYPLAPDITILKSIMMAGGITTEGSMNAVVLIHYENDGTITVFKTNLNEVIAQGDILQDLALGPQDVIYVPMTGVADANLFINQYIDKMLPFVRGVNYNYNKNPDLGQ